MSRSSDPRLGVGEHAWVERMGTAVVGNGLDQDIEPVNVRVPRMCEALEQAGIVASRGCSLRQERGETAQVPPRPLLDSCRNRGAHPPVVGCARCFLW